MRHRLLIRPGPVVGPRTLPRRRRGVLVSCVVAAAVALIVTMPASSADPALVSSCAPAINGTGTIAPGTVIAPYLRVVKSSYSLGTCDSTISATARSADGTIWGVDQGDSKNGLWKSTDDLASWQLVYQATGYSSVEQVLPLASGYLLIVVRDSNNIRHILRSTTTSGTAFAAPSLNLPSGAYLHDPQSWTQSGGAIYVAEYGDASPPIVVWKSTDDGQSFFVAYSRTDARHYHSIQPDSFRSGRLWLDVGDTGTEPRIGYSDDGAATFSWITQVTYPQSRALDMTFASDSVYWGADVPEQPASLYRWDRQTGAISTILANLNGPFYNTFAANGIDAQFSGIERNVADGYIGDDYIHVLTSNGGSGWTATKTPLMRPAGDTTEVAYMDHFTPPDSQGRFWGSFFNLNGTQFKNCNIEFQLDPTAAFNGVKASFTTTPNPAAPGQSVTFDASASSSPHAPLTYDWDFGDGSAATGRVATHSYAAAGAYTVRLQATDANGDASESRRTLSVTSGGAGAPPVATTAAPTGITASGATLNGTVNPNGATTTAHFEWGTTTAYGNVTGDQSVGSGTSPVSLSAALSGLSANTTYHYRIVAANTNGTSQGADATFTTTASAGPPTVSTSPATGLTSNSATLNGVVNPNGLATTAQFEYGTTSAYGSTTPSQSVGSGTSNVSVTAGLTGLAANTTYHYRIVAASTAGTARGNDLTFTTPSQPAPPTATTAAPSAVTKTGATFNGTVNPGGGTATYYFEYGTTTAYGVQTTSAAVSGTADVSVSSRAKKLTAGTAYHVRLVATSSSGTTYGQDVQFTTSS